MSTVPAERPRHALGLPAGSVRALLAFGVLAYLWILALGKSKDGGPLLSEERVATAFVYLQVLMVLILAHFFVAHGKTIGSRVSHSSPLGMPRGSVRFVLLGGYLGLAYFMYATKPPFQVPETMPVMLMLAVLVTCFIVGHALTNVVVWFARGSTPAWFQDIQAWFALMGMVVLGIVVILRLVINYSLPLGDQLNLDVIEAILAGIAGFYFGARS
jgi:hypothetical protein